MTPMVTQSLILGIAESVLAFVLLMAIITTLGAALRGRRFHFTWSNWWVTLEFTDSGLDVAWYRARVDRCWPSLTLSSSQRSSVGGNRCATFVRALRQRIIHVRMSHCLRAHCHGMPIGLSMLAVITVQSSGS